jgi:hypothetical protein
MRIGKIARLPRQVRTEINQRLDNGEEAESILAWLNQDPAVQEMLEEHFQGAAISAQNLSEWRQGGFREWEFRREIIEQACSTSDFAQDLEDEVITSELPGKLAAVLAARYAALLSQWQGDLHPAIAEAFCVLRSLNKDIALLQKTLHLAQQQKRENEKAIDDEEKAEMEEEKKRETAPFLARIHADTMTEALGGGEKNRLVAEYLAASKYDRPLPPDYEERLQKLRSAEKSENAENRPNQPSVGVQSNLIKPSKGKMAKKGTAHEVGGGQEEAQKEESA